MLMESPLCERHELTASVLRQMYKIDEGAGLSVCCVCGLSLMRINISFVCVSFGTFLRRKSAIFNIAGIILHPLGNI